MKAHIVSFVIGISILLAPAVGQAFVATNHSFTALSDRVGLYQLQYELGYDQYDMVVPALVGDAAAGRIAVEAASPQAGVTVYGIALGDSNTLEQGQYRIAAGDVMRFTLYLIVMADTASSLPESLAVTALPFTLQDGATSRVNGLSRGELGSFVIAGPTAE